jgi:hypothetical protein
MIKKICKLIKRLESWENNNTINSTIDIERLPNGKFLATVNRVPDDSKGYYNMEMCDSYRSALNWARKECLKVK